MGAGRKELTPGLLADYATVLGIPLADLAALTDIEPPDPPPPQNPAAPHVAELIWDVRRLTIQQVRQASDYAMSMLQE